MADHAHSTTMSAIPTVRASATALPNSSRRFFLGRSAAAISGAAIGAAIPLPSVAATSAHAATTPVISEALRAAIAAHKAVQAMVDAMNSEDDAWDATLDAERDALWALTETPCQSDADFFEKVAYLLKHAKHVLRGLFTHATDFGELAFAIELHLEQKGMSAESLASV
jgi:hypothetical protein